MPRYELLAEFLENLKDEQNCKFSFNDIEDIILDKLPASAHLYSAWWSNSPSHPLMKVVLKTGWKAVKVDLKNREVYLTHVGQPILLNMQTKKYREWTSPSSKIRRMDERVKELKGNFDVFLEYFDTTSIFSGPSLYFHQKVIDILRKDGLVFSLENELFFDYLYATLTAWGLHRMGETKTKLVDFDKFKDSIISHKNQFLMLKNIRITEFNDNTKAINELQSLMTNLKIGEGETKLVFNSKTIHHLLPDLMPPIDRQYTLLFFYNSTNLPRIDSRFGEIFPKFIEIAAEKKDYIRKRVGKGFHTSETKVIDNAIVGYVLKKRLKKQK